MENVPPPNNNPNAPEEEPIMDQSLTALVEFVPQWNGEHISNNNNGWLEEEPEEEEENEAMVNDEEDDAKIVDVDDVPKPHVIQFGSNFHVGESSASRDLFKGNSKVCTPGPMCYDLKSVHIGVKRLSKHMHDRYRMEKKIAKMLRQDELRSSGQEFDITVLDSAVKVNRFENSKIMRLITDLSREFTELKNQNRRAEELSHWEAWVRGRIPNHLRFQEEPSIYTAPVPCADDAYVMVRDAAMGTREDEDVDTNAPMDTQPSEPQDVDQLVGDGIAAAIRDERERVRREATRAEGHARGPVTAPIARECSFTGFIKCGPTQFHGTEGAIGLVRWFEKMENTFEISKCAEVKKAEVKQMMTDEFCPTEEVQRLEDELRHLKLRDMNIAAYTERFNDLALLCLDAVPNEKKKVEFYIKGLPEIIKVANQTEVAPKYNRCGRCHFDQYPPKCENCGRIGHKAKDYRGKNVASGATVQPNIVCYRCGERGHKSSECPKKADRRGRNVQGMDWLVECDALIVCGKKEVNEVNVPYKNKMLVVKSDSGVSRLKVISCIKARKYIERGSQLFIAQVTKKESVKKQLQDMPVICNFPKVFPNDLPRLPPPRQVEFKIELIPSAAPVAHAPYRLAPSKLKELSDELKELSEKGFIHSSSSPWGAPVLFMKKKDESFHMCIDYRELNKLTVKNRYPLLRIDDLFDQLQGSSEDHEEHLKTILELLKNEKLYIKFSKCDLWLKSVHFLSHVIDNNGVYVDPAKVKAIRNWSAPTTPTEVRQFLGMEEEEAFQTLKQKLCSTPILALPEGTRNFIVYYNASLKGFGAVLMEREKVIAYASRQLKKYEKNYRTHDLELGAVKAEHQNPFGLLQQPEIPKWKWEKIIIDFISGLPRTLSGYDSIWFNVDCLTKSAHFLLMKKTDSIEKLAQLYLKEIVCRHGVPVSIIPDRDSLFTSRFWETLQKALGTKLNLSTTYHPEMDGQSKRTIQMLEDMLRACAIDFGNSWDRHLPLVEFSYNNSYHASIKATSFKALYGRKCRSPVC
nr:putative ribonuclease H-like domain-containing protein [Tanacetum cinerariifolium]